MIRAVIFDLDDTLYDYHTLHKEAFKRVQELVVERLGVSGEQSEEAFRRARIATKENLGETAASHSRMLYFQKRWNIWISDRCIWRLTCTRYTGAYF